MPVITAADAQEFSMEGTTVTALAAPSRGSTELCAWRLRLAPGLRTPAHSLTREEVFVILSGTAVASIDGLRQLVAPGDALVVPADLPFELTVGADAALEAVVAFPAGGMAHMPPGEGQPFPPPWAV